MFPRKSLKGTRGIFQAKDVEKYLQEIMDLEKSTKLGDIHVARLESQLNSVMHEMNNLRKQISRQDTTIQELRAENIDLKTRLTELQGKHSSIVKEQGVEIQKFKKELGKAPARDDYETVVASKDKLDRQVKDMQKAIENRDTQLHRLTEENLKLKDKLKFLKQEN
jgi:chromosome segregation ATPase